MVKPGNRLIWLDALRLCAGLSMVGLHASADPNGQPWPAYAQAERIAPMILRSFLYVARTELFLVISVFLLILALDQRPRSYRQTLREQSRRLLVPFAFWTVFYAGYGLNKAFAFGYGGSALAQVLDPLSWPGFLLLGSVKYHMHFIPTLFGILLLLPLYRTAFRFPVLGLAILPLLLMKRELDVFLYAEFWGQDILPYLARAVKILAYAGYGMAAAAFYAVWTRASVQDRAAWVAPAVLAGGLLFALKLAAAWKTAESGQWPHGHTPGYWADYLMPVLLFAVCMCLGHRAWPQILSRLAPFSFGIYLCHPVFLDLAEIWLRGAEWTPVLIILVKIVLVVPATALCVWLLSRTRALAWTIGLGSLPRIGRARPVHPV
jgi:surface polysaccharide O-acyltransferase-like enzyme